MVGFVAIAIVVVIGLAAGGLTNAAGISPEPSATFNPPTPPPTAEMPNRLEQAGPDHRVPCEVRDCLKPQAIHEPLRWA